MVDYLGRVFACFRGGGCHHVDLIGSDTRLGYGCPRRCRGTLEQRIRPDAPGFCVDCGCLIRSGNGHPRRLANPSQCLVVCHRIALSHVDLLGGVHVE